MNTLFYTSVATSIVATAALIYMIWVEPSAFVTKVFVTLLVLLVVQVVTYLIMHDTKEDGEGKRDGTIAQ